MNWTAFMDAAAGWLGTFAIHSTLALGFAWLVSTLLQQRWLGLQEVLLRTSLWLGLVSASVQCVVGTPFAAELRLPDSTVAVALPSPSEANAWPELTLAPDATGWLAVVEPSPFPWRLLLVVGSAVAASGGLVWLLRLQRRLARLLTDRRPEVDPRVLATAAEAAAAAGLRHSPHVSRSEWLDTPIAFGLLHPEICLPDRVTELSTSSLRAMLAHEIAHLRRADPAWMWGAAALQALFPWQLLLVAVRRRWSRLVELRCDAIAAEQVGATAVAHCLLDVAAWLQPRPAASLVALGMAARPSALRERVDAALQGVPMGPRQRAIGALGGSLLCGALTFAAPGVQSGTPLLVALLADAEGIDLADVPSPPSHVTPPTATATPSSPWDLLLEERRQLQAEVDQVQRQLGARTWSPELRQLDRELRLRLERLDALLQRLQPVLAPSTSTFR